MNPTPAYPNIPPPGGETSEAVLGEAPGDTEAIGNPAALVEAILRHPRRVMYQLRQGAAGRLIVRLTLLGVVFGAAYGVIVGSFSGGMQWWAAPAKIAAGMLVTAMICLPSLYIFTCLSGSTARLHEVTGALGGLLVLATLLLIGFGPVAWLFSQSTESIAMLGTIHLAFWLVGARFGIRFLCDAFRHFGLKSEAGLRVWVTIFVLVSLQMATALRPLVGTAPTLFPSEKKFFVVHWMDCVNAPPSHGRP